MIDNVSFPPAGERTYHFEVPAARRRLRRSALIVALAFVLVYVPMLCEVCATLAVGDSLTPVSILLIAIAVLALGFAVLSLYYGFYIMQNHVLILTPTGVIDHSPLARTYSPWSNVVGIGPAQIQTGNPRYDQLLARWDVGRVALILREPVAAEPLAQGILARLFGRLLQAQTWGRAGAPTSYILLTYCVGPRPDDDVVRDVQRYAPHLIPHA